MLIGLVGKPNVGKSTFFKAMTLMNVLIEDYPFATIKPNRGVGHVSVKCVEDEFKTKCNPATGYCLHGQRFTPVELLDVAGLVPGAHEGKGMGNQFLDDLRQADALIHVIDVSGSTNEKGDNVEPGSYDPANDIRFLEDELDYWIKGLLKKVWLKFARRVEQDKKELHKAIAEQFSGLKITEEQVKKSLKDFDITKPSSWTDNELLRFASKLRKESKPIVIAANKVDKPYGKENLERLKKEFSDYRIIGCSAEVELALKEAMSKELIDYIPGDNDFSIISDELPEKQLKGLEFINKFLNRGSTGVQQVLDQIVLNELGYIAVFPGGTKALKDSKGRTLPDCFLLPKGSTALDFAYHIHTDIGDKFVKAIDVRTKQALSKDYELKHRDVIEIMTR